MRFTDRRIQALKPRAERYEVFEDGRPGFGLRVSPSCRKSFVYLFRHEGRPRRMTLGTYPALSLHDAHVKHAEAEALVKKGQDPGALLVETRRAERHAETVAELIDEYLDKYARPNKRSAAADERALRKDVEPAWGRRKAKSIGRRDIITLLDGIVGRGSPVMANRLLEILRKMFAFAVQRGILEATPCVLIDPPAKETPRDRVLTPAEIKTVWTSLGEAKMSEAARLALKFLLATGQRREEVLGAAWVEFDVNECVWEIPASRTKTGRAHRVPISSLAQNLFAEIKAVAGESQWLFPSPRGGKPMAGAALSHAVRNNLDRLGTAKFTPHDMRRTVASGLAELGFDRLIISKVLGHADGSITGLYDRFGYGPQKRHALETWGCRLKEIVTGESAAENVVPLAAGGKPA